MTARRFGFLTTFYPPYNFGGDGIGVQRLARALVRRGHEVTVIHDADAYAALANGAPTDGAAADDGVKVVTLRSRTPRLATLLTHQTGRPVVNGRRLRRLLADGRFDVVQFHNVSSIGGPGLLALAAAAGAAATLYIAHEHWLVCPTHVLWRHRRELCDGRQCFRCQLHYRRPPQLWRRTGLLERNLRYVDRFLALSEFSRDKHRELGFPREMELLPYFVDDPGAEPPPAVDPPPHARPYFLFAGRLERFKGSRALVEASARYPDADLLLAGDGAERPALERLAAGNSRVRFLGRLAPDELDAFYRSAIALVVPSRCFETFGNVIVESFAQGTPVIARRLGPFPELVERSGGGLLFDGDGDLVPAMNRLQHQPDERARMARAGFQACRALWSESVVVPRYLELVERTIAERAAKPSGHR